MDFGIDGKVALIAAGSSGSGLATARDLAREGCKVMLTGRNEGRVQAAVRAIRDERGAVEGVVTDMTSQSGVDRALQAVRTTYGDPSILVINPPAANFARAFDNLSDQALEEAFAIWVMSIVRLARGTLPKMVSAKWGRIVLLGSIGMKMLHLDDPLYAHNIRVGAVGLIKTIAHEFGASGITANVIAVGPVMSESVQELYLSAEGALEADRMTDATGLKRWGTPEEIASVVAFLCSMRASYVTGETIRVDGNYTHNLF